MIRFVTIASLVSLLVLVLYLPSANPPARFVTQLRTEHNLAGQFWGDDTGARILALTLDLHAIAKEAVPAPSIGHAEAANSVNFAVAGHMSQVTARFLTNEYFRSIDALVALATYRLCVLERALPLLAFFFGAVLFDGWVARVIRSKEFLQHDPEKFAVYVCAAIFSACSMIVALVLPITIHPLILCAAPVAQGVFVSRALANFHRRA